MRVLLFGASGMVGQGVLRECLLDPGVTHVLSIGRGIDATSHPKLRSVKHENFLDFTALEPELTHFDACFFCLGISSVGMTEADYRRITYDYTLTAARTLVKTSPQLTFIYVSGTGTDSTAKGGTMWARVKGATENALLALPFKAACMFRPGFIQPLDGIKSKTAIYRVAYVISTPIVWLFGGLLRRSITTTRQVGRAMIRVARDGPPKRWLTNADINQL